MTTTIKTTTIRNISKMTTDEIKLALKDAGIEVPAKARRAKLISLCREHELFGLRGNVVPLQYKRQYGAAQNCGDEMAQALADHVRVPNEDGKGDHIDLDILAEVATANGVDLSKWAHLNVGMQRMNLSNVLRGKLKRGEKVAVGTTTWNEEPSAAEAL